MANGHFFIINGIKCVFGSADAGTAKPSGSGTTSLAPDSAALGYAISEYEPNTSLNGANPLLMNDAATVNTDFAGGFRIIQQSANSFLPSVYEFLVQRGE